MSTETQSASIHQPGTTDGWHGVIKSGGEFEPEAGRYHLYIGSTTYQITLTLEYD
jgi:glutathionyl-hydroquinone reductase